MGEPDHRDEPDGTGRSGGPRPPGEVISLVLLVVGAVVFLVVMVIVANALR